MSSTLADQVLQIRWVALLAVVVLTALLAPPLYESLRPPTVRLDTVVETLITPDGELTINWDDSESVSALMIRRWNADGTATILGTIPVGAAEDFGMVCDADTPQPERYLFGSVDRRDARSAIDLRDYIGPPAVGARFERGMYLLALAAGEVDPDAEIILRRTDRFDVRTASDFDDIVRYGKHEAASGCFIA